jgi:hypothetical protein
VGSGVEILGKLGVRTRVEAIQVAKNNGWLWGPTLTSLLVA